MTVRRWFCALALVVMSFGTGCAAWCSRHYPCPNPGYAGYGYGYAQPQVACVPCCQPGSAYPTSPAPAPGWNTPGVACPPCR